MLVFLNSRRLRTQRVRTNPHKLSCVPSARDLRIKVSRALGLGSVGPRAAQEPTTARNSLIISCHNQVPSEYVLFIIELAKRVVHIAGITTQPNEGWMMHVARNLTDQFAGCLADKTHLIVDRDTKYTAQYRRLIAESRTAVTRLPPRSPNLNAYAERFVRSIKEECLDRMIFVEQGALRRAVTEFVAHYYDVSYCPTSLRN